MVPSGLAQSTGEAKLCESGDPLNLALVGVLDFDRWGKESSRRSPAIQAGTGMGMEAEVVVCMKRQTRASRRV